MDARPTLIFEWSFTRPERVTEERLDPSQGQRDSRSADGSRPWPVRVRGAQRLGRSDVIKAHLLSSAKRHIELYCIPRLATITCEVPSRRSVRTRELSSNHVLPAGGLGSYKVRRYRDTMRRAIASGGVDFRFEQYPQSSGHLSIPATPLRG
jgi:hypothetical protein